jgi:serine/threonine-protein kinase
MEVLLAHVKQPPPLPSSLAPVPADLEEVILRCLAKDPQQRPVDAEAFAAELSACRDARTWTVTDARAWWAKHAQTTPETEATAKESPGPVLSDVRLTSCDLSQL